MSDHLSYLLFLIYDLDFFFFGLHALIPLPSLCFFKKKFPLRSSVNATIIRMLHFPDSQLKVISPLGSLPISIFILPLPPPLHLSFFLELPQHLLLYINSTTAGRYGIVHHCIPWCQHHAWHIGFCFCFSNSKRKFI